MVKTKWQSLAQRKFAQGAYIPPVSATSTTPERKIDQQTTTVRDSTNIVLNNISAKSLLDAVCFREYYHNNILQPTVVLNRLSSTQINKTPRQKTVGLSPSMRIITRSRAKKNRQIRSTVLEKRNILKNFKTDGAPAVNELDDFNMEDNTPLNHLKNVQQQENVNGIVEAAEPITTVAIEVTTVNEPAPNVPVKVDAVETSSYYSSQGIQKWLAHSFTEGEIVEILDDVPESPQEGLKSVSNAQVQNTDDVQCTCDKYEQIMHITRVENSRDYASRCFKCIKCRLVDKLTTLSTLVIRANLQIENNENDSSDELISTEQRPEFNSTRDDSTQFAESSNDGNFYIDMNQQLDQIIEISPAGVDGIVRAKLVPRSRARPVNNFSLLEHEHLIDQLLTSLMVSCSELSKGTLIHLIDNAGDQNNHAPKAALSVNLTCPENTKVEPGTSTDLITFNPNLASIDKQENISLSDTSTKYHLRYESSDIELMNIEDGNEDVIAVIPTSQEMDVTNIEAHIDLSDIESVNNDQMSNDKDQPSDLVPGTVETRCEAASLQTTIPLPVLPTSNNRASQVYSDAVEAPIFHPTAKEFQNPIAYFEQIIPEASKFGLCKVVPPSNFKPSCIIDDNIRFKVVNQYIGRLFSRWGPATKMMCAIRAHLASEKVKFTRAPLVEGMEVNLPKLCKLVELHGGVVKVMAKKRWGRIAEEMGLPKTPKPDKKIEQVYLKCLLPYQMLSDTERERIIQNLDKAWNKRHDILLKHSANPLNRNEHLLEESESSGEESDDKDHIEEALTEAEDCIVPGRTMTLSSYKKIAMNTFTMIFPKSTELTTSTKTLEEEYWNLVTKGNDHVCVNSASIDTGAEGYGFTKNKSDKYSRHSWNLKMLSQDSGNMLRFLGRVLGVTVPTLHLGMLFSTSCWHSDPHGLPWMEFMHEGPAKIWYGVPDEQSAQLNTAVSQLCPTICQNKSIWLPSDVTMIPPGRLLEHKVSLTRVEQRPGEFIIVFPKAYSCSISTGYTVSESVYFATASWLSDVSQLFKKLKFCCEPTMFSLEMLLVAAAKDEKAPVTVLNTVRTSLFPLIEEEQLLRNQLKQQVVDLMEVEDDSRFNKCLSHWNTQEQDECEICRSTLFFSKVSGMTANKTYVCLEHAVQLVKSSKSSVNQVTLITHFSDEDIDDLVKSLEKRTVENK